MLHSDLLVYAEYEFVDRRLTMLREDVVAGGTAHGSAARPVVGELREGVRHHASVQRLSDVADARQRWVNPRECLRAADHRPSPGHGFHGLVLGAAAEGQRYQDYVGIPIQWRQIGDVSRKADLTVRVGPRAGGSRRPVRYGAACVCKLRSRSAASDGQSEVDACSLQRGRQLPFKEQASLAVGLVSEVADKEQANGTTWRGRGRGFWCLQRKGC